MKKTLITLLLGAAIYRCQAQTTNTAITEHDPTIKAKDEQIKAEIIDPARKAASPGDPDWGTVTKTIIVKYDAVTADRTVTKAKIYYYYSRDKGIFCTNIVHFTNNWELANDYQLLNLNAGMILQWDDNPTELKEALRWAKAAADSDPTNEKFKITYDALSAKVSQ
jgi:hypothetical protein